MKIWLLKDKVAIITVCGPHAVWVCYREIILPKTALKWSLSTLNGEVSEAAAAALGRRSSRLAANVADEVQVQAAIEQIMAKYGRVDVLVNVPVLLSRRS